MRHHRDLVWGTRRRERGDQANERSHRSTIRRQYRSSVCQRPCDRRVRHRAGVKFVTTSAGSPTKYTATLKAAGLTVYHVVPTLQAALKAVDAGVDGLVVEGGEGGGFKSPTPVSTMVLLPLIRSQVDVPIIAAGGICDGMTMAAAFALGAEGVQMGTQMVAAKESPVHDNWKQAIVNAAETDTIFLNEQFSPALRALRTGRSERLSQADHNVFGEFGNAKIFTSGATWRPLSPSQVKLLAVSTRSAR